MPVRASLRDADPPSSSVPRERRLQVRLLDGPVMGFLQARMGSKASYSGTERRQTCGLEELTGLPATKGGTTEAGEIP